MPSVPFKTQRPRRFGEETEPLPLNGFYHCHTLWDSALCNYASVPCKPPFVT